MIHSHGHGHGHDHDHDHSHDLEPALKDSLYSKIDIDNVRGYNESDTGAAKGIIKPWHQRKERTPCLESDCDEQLIVFIPLTGMAKIKSILLIGGPGAQSPAKLKVFINSDDIDFDNVEDRTCTQEWDLIEDSGKDVVEYHTRITKFGNVRSLTLYFPENFGEDTTRLQYIGLTGEWTELRDEPLLTVYELKPNMADHKVPGDESRVHQNIF
ncbi:galactose-binding domain-like protein [Dimargaris cristalligena]|uniref:Galactose-binding domain-like protein n=1 Tax=Dimargaris cristalligena TaxID=215637 RepID=A0A4Q0A171_9FUNG|nr:galactose-binding domain-like protein [Dimargaris cristalligena]|eukprot:RKP39774.1 galactose-binding domain-like protein [Dimargaris cristalligena]